MRDNGKGTGSTTSVRRSISSGVAAGRLYETLLREMRDAAGDSGEFYTPRPVVRFMVAVTDPQLGETILDPACGTAGFLTETFLHLERQADTVEKRRILQDRSVMGGEAKSLPFLLAHPIQRRSKLVFERGGGGVRKVRRKTRRPEAAGCGCCDGFDRLDCGALLSKNIASPGSGRADERRLRRMGSRGRGRFCPCCAVLPKEPTISRNRRNDGNKATLLPPRNVAAALQLPKTLRMNSEEARDVCQRGMGAIKFWRIILTHLPRHHSPPKWPRSSSAHRRA